MDFDKRFDKQFKKTQKFAFAWVLFTGALSLAGVCFVAWVIVKILQHFGVV